MTLRTGNRRNDQGRGKEFAGPAARNFAGRERAGVVGYGSVGLRPSRQAFTLIELILVMTILTAVIAVTAPSLSNFFRGRTLDSEAKRLLALTRHGQGRAVSEGMPMELWMDAAQQTFGLEAETSYTDNDPKALDFTLDKNIQMEVITLKVPSAIITLRTANAAEIASKPLLLSKHPNVPTIQFLPDGSISETSPQMVHLLDRDGASRWLVQSRSRLNYEIRNQSNRPTDQYE